MNKNDKIKRVNKKITLLKKEYDKNLDNEFFEYPLRLKLTTLLHYLYYLEQLRELEAKEFKNAQKD